MPKRLILIFLVICISPSLIFSQTLPFTFSPNTPAKAEEVNSNFQFLAKQFKKNEKTINCPNDNISQAIADGYNHLIINGTCVFTALITPFDLPEFGQYGFTSIHPTPHLTLEGGTNGIINPEPSVPGGMLVFGGALRIKNLTMNQTIYSSFNSRVNVSESTLSRIDTQQGSAVDLNNVTVNCDDKACIYVKGSSYLRAEGLTINNSLGGSMISVREFSSANIKDSTLSDTSNNSDGGHTAIDVDGGYLGLDETTVTISDGDVFVGSGGKIELRGGQITRSSGSPTVRVTMASFQVMEGASVDSIQCESSVSYAPVSDDSNVGSVTPDSCKYYPQ